VDLETRWLTLEDGTVIQTVDDTEHALHDRGGGSLSSLEAVAQALDAGLTVFAAGVGIVRSEDPPVLVALRLHLFLRAELAEFHGRVTSVDLSARTFTLEDGTTVRLFAGSVICFGDDPVRFRSLEAVAEALAAGHAVNASGLGAVLSEGALLALRVSFGRALREFEGLVLAVDLVARTVELEDGTIVRVPPNPAVVHRASDDGDRVVLHSLEAVAEALEAGKAVLAAGVGTLESSDPVTIAAVRVVFFLKPPPVHRFEGPVASVDLDARTVTLESGTLIRVPTDEVIHHEGDDDHTLASLAAVAEAVAAGTRVVAHGVGELESEEPRTLVATKVIFSLDPPGLRRFEGTVASVDLDARTLRLEGGTLIRLTDDTRIHGANAPAVVYESNVPGQLLPTLEAVARALEAGATVYAAGAGTVETEEPLTIVAAEIAFFARPPVLVFFEGAVASVNLDARTVTLQGDRVLALSESSEIVVNDHALPSLAAVAEALAAGKTVIAAGVAAPPLSEGGAEQVVKVVFVVAEG
jgi:predicted RNA-binding protein